MDKIENSWSRNYKKTENDTANTYNMTPLILKGLLYMKIVLLKVF